METSEYIKHLENYIARLEDGQKEMHIRLSGLERLTAALLRIEWDRRGQAKGEAAKIERELELSWNEYLDRHKIGV